MLISAVTLAAAAPASAAPLPYPDRTVTYEVVEQDLTAVIDGVARQVGVHAEVSSKVEGRVHGRLPADTARGLLDKLASIYGFEWYFDGQSVHVSAASESVAKIVPLRKVVAAELQETLAHLGILDARWPLRFSRRGDVVEIAGPPHYVALIEQTISALPEPRSEAAVEVRIFRGSSASLP